MPVGGVAPPNECRNIIETLMLERYVVIILLLFLMQQNAKSVLFFCSGVGLT